MPSRKGTRVVGSGEGSSVARPEEEDTCRWLQTADQSESSSTDSSVDDDEEPSCFLAHEDGESA